MKNLFRYIIMRVLLTIPMLLILLSVVFVVLHVMPGDPILSMLGGHAPPALIEAKRHELGLDQPIIVQYGRYLEQIAHFDLGNSMIFQQSVIDAIKDKLPATIELSFFGMVICLLVGIPLGAYAADKRRSPQDYLARLYGIVIYCIPVYWMGLLLQMVFGVWLNWFPIAGRTGSRVIISTFQHTGFYVIDTIMAHDWSDLWDVLWHLALPSITLGLYLSGIFVRLTRANMLDVLKSDYVLAAEARGIRHKVVVYKHALKNAFVPILTMLGLQVALLMAGAVLTETTFSWPGMGRLLLERIYLRDYPTIQGIIVIFALIVAAVSLMVDIVYALVDPRVRY